MRIQEIIQKKRDGQELSDDELGDWLRGYLAGEVADYQMSAWLMAVFFRGMTSRETATWTKLMWQSGESFPRSHREKEFWLDKHSTGGVGDKTSLLLVPWLISLARHQPKLFPRGLKIPMISGRGLGHTGGTLDKLESVPGFSSAISLGEAERLLHSQGYCMMGQTSEVAPADKRLYALRDVTATVDCLPLIVSSILSKKLAESLDCLVLDVKYGAGAFMADAKAAQQLADALVSTAKQNGLQARTVLTETSEPLGYAVGNLIEVIECENFLQGTSRAKDLLAVTELLAEAAVLAASQASESSSTVRRCLAEELESRRPVAVFQEMLVNQGAKWNEYQKRKKEFEGSPKFEVIAARGGTLRSVDVLGIANLVRDLGGGRKQQSDTIDPLVGVEVRAKRGDVVSAGQVLAELRASKTAITPSVKEQAAKWFLIAEGVRR